MTHFELHIGSINPKLPLDGLSALGSYIADHIVRGSRDDISISVVDRGLLQNALAEGEMASPLRLHQALTVLTGNALEKPVTKLGLILASDYAPARGTFGFMFDLGFRTPEDPNDGAYIKVPRQGCALFLNSIKDARPTQSDYVDQVKFTAVHEVGHVFNLIHQSLPLTFMAPSLATRTHAASAYFFDDDQKAWLTQCSINPDVMPGGSIFRDAGHLPFDKTMNSTYIQRAGLDLAVELTSHEFWRFEPVHLNMVVKTSDVEPSEKRRLPAELDPGYSRFKIVITGPNGTTRYYRAPINFCSTGRLLTVTRAKPFARDIPIFGQAGGYTFDEPGPHRLSVEFQFSKRETLRSNEIQFNVKPSETDPRFEAAQKILSLPSTARALFYREAEPDHLRRLIRQVASYDNLPSAMLVRYLCASAAIKRQASTLARKTMESIPPSTLPNHQQARIATYLASAGLGSKRPSR